MLKRPLTLDEQISNVSLMLMEFIGRRDVLWMAISIMKARKRKS